MPQNKPGTILLVEPHEGGGGDIFLSVSYGELEHNATIEKFLEKSEVIEIIEIAGPRDIPLRFHVTNAKDKFGPVFIGLIPTFTPFIVLVGENEPLHCDECGRIVVNWLAENQLIWQEKYYGDWRTTHGAGNGQGSQRVH